MTRRMLIAGNWKMNGLSRSLAFFDALQPPVATRPDLDVLVCPPATLLAAAAAKAGPVHIGAQDCHSHESGAHTGDISAAMIKDAGAAYVIVGHSERRADHGETSETVKAKAVAAQMAGLVPIICVGETKNERDAGKARSVVGEQLDASLPDEAPYVVAYEPVWAIGTGLTASTDDIADMHAFIRLQLKAGDGIQILYGGSMKPANASAILALEDVDGGLIGGASLKADDFTAIIQAAPVRTEMSG
ncbi:triose-phosphate isomerase [Hyphobacterium sp.]|uniref:triose-phosphate isomerase n=1 Tax=Hyphobacterium sp. TaxID=2004662 RepID=UPI003BABB402